MEEEEEVEEGEEAERDRPGQRPLRAPDLGAPGWEKAPEEPWAQESSLPALARPGYVKLAGCRGFFTPPLDSSLGGSRGGRRAWGRGGGGVFACLRARSSGRMGFLPRFFLIGSCLAARAGGLFWGEEGSSRRRGPGRAFFTWSSSSEEEEEAEEERTEDEEDEERLDLAAAGTGSWKLEKKVMNLKVKNRND